MRDNEDGDDVAAGYKKPPRAHRFVKGRSGNPQGRPRKAPARMSEDRIKMTREESQRIITIHEDGKPVKMSVARAIIRSCFARAISKGSSHTLRTATALLAEIGEIDKRLMMPSDADLDKMDVHEATRVYKMVMNGTYSSND